MQEEINPPKNLLPLGHDIITIALPMRDLYVSTFPLMIAETPIVYLISYSKGMGMVMRVVDADKGEVLVFLWNERLILISRHVFFIRNRFIRN